MTKAHTEKTCHDVQKKQPGQIRPFRHGIWITVSVLWLFVYYNDFFIRAHFIKKSWNQCWIPFIVFTKMFRNYIPNGGADFIYHQPHDVRCPSCLLSDVGETWTNRDTCNNKHIHQNFQRNDKTVPKGKFFWRSWLVNTNWKNPLLSTFQILYLKKKLWKYISKF